MPSTPKEADSTSTPATIDTNPIVIPENEQDFRQLVTSLIVDEQGNPKEIVFPEGTSPAVKMAINAEKSRRQSLAQYTKTAQELALEKARADKAGEVALSNAKDEFTPSEIEELNKLKESDVDAWRVRYNELDALRLQRAKEAVTTAMTVDPSTLVNASYEEQLKAFNSTVAKPLTSDELAYDIPPRLTKQLNEGVLTYEEYLTKAYEVVRGAVAPITTTRIDNNVVTPKAGSITEQTGELDINELTL